MKSAEPKPGKDDDPWQTPRIDGGSRKLRGIAEATVAATKRQGFFSLKAQTCASETFSLQSEVVDQAQRRGGRCGRSRTPSEGSEPLAVRLSSTGREESVAPFTKRGA